ncbi:helix-turn-helix domain-containing protein [Campylobacter gastrosuis]|uniref:Helix-turn-helix domain-containing protein n=1 Tax=Campylobacter gastrosuis TaxID=2974576 RepID=A0ABT7HNJ7_9BACT|nr:helix-turn-helix transcriptional regulator [Campylobacter gastrosuis]MDL0088484.1 helix-turn-helix domain-containing protein [Campylobacter gastrosuis]
MTSEELKAFCKERNLTYKELAELIGNSEATIHSAIAKGELSVPMSKSIQMYQEILTLREQLKEYAELKAVLKKALKDD